MIKRQVKGQVWAAQGTSTFLLPYGTSGRETPRYHRRFSPGWLRTRSCPSPCCSWFEGQRSWERGLFYLPLRLLWNRNPQPASACLAQQVREHGPEHPPPLQEAEVYPTPCPVRPPGSTEPCKCPASRARNQAEATVNNLLLSI